MSLYAVEEPDTDRSHFTYLKRDQLSTLPDLTPMIDGVVDKGTVSCLVAQPAAGKSFLAVDWACCYATGKDWQGRQVNNNLTYPNDRPAHGSVLYVAGEGARGLKSRVDAWEHAWGYPVPNDQLVVMPHPVQLGNRIEVDTLCNDLRSEVCGLVIIDTLARCSSGVEENSAGEMGRIIDAAYRIRESMGPDGTVILVHHLGKTGEIRGSSALLGGVDQVLRLTRDGDTLELKDEKRKDAEELAPMQLVLTGAKDSRVISSMIGEDLGNSLVDIMHNKLSHLMPIGKTDLKAAAGMPDTQFFNCLNRGIADGKIEQSQDKTPKYHLVDQR